MADKRTTWLSITLAAASSSSESCAWRWSEAAPIGSTGSISKRDSFRSKAQLRSSSVNAHASQDSARSSNFASIDLNEHEFDELEHDRDEHRGSGIQMLVGID
jgi:hypothetical protein